MLKKRPGILLKFFFKMPLLLHKFGMGGWERLIGAEWMLITTTGRKTGKLHKTLVDVMDYNPDNDTYYIEAAYGSHADWYRNIKASPIFEAQIGRRKFKAQAIELSEAATGEMLVQFYQRKPAYTRSVMAMAGMKFKDEDELRTFGNKLILLAVKTQSPSRSSK